MGYGVCLDRDIFGRYFVGRPLFNKLLGYGVDHLVEIYIEIYLGVGRPLFNKQEGVGICIFERYLVKILDIYGR